MRIWLWSVLIIKTGGEQALYIATDHVWRQAYPVNTLSRWNMAFFYDCILQRKTVFLCSMCCVRAAQSVSPFIRCTQFWEHLIRASEVRFLSVWGAAAFPCILFPNLVFFAPLNLKVVSHVSKWTVFTTHYRVSIQCKLSLPLHSLSHSDASDQVLASSVGCTVFQSNMLL